MSFTNYWKLAKSGKFCDLKIIEHAKNDTTLTYSVHRLVLYQNCVYFTKLFDTGLKDSNTNEITIETENENTGILRVILKSIYCGSSPLPCRYEAIYKKFVATKDVNEIMSLYILCEYLNLTEHLVVLQNLIRKIVDIKKIVSWWKARNNHELAIPNGIENIVQRHLKDNTKQLMGVSYISVDALLELWPSGKINDPMTKEVQDFLATLKKFTANDEYRDDPNTWLDDDCEEVCAECGEDCSGCENCCEPRIFDPDRGC